MLIWLNGPHGVGKTQAAFELHRRLPGSVVCDPEHLVNGLHRMLPEIIGPLRTAGHAVHHVTLLASRDVLTSAPSSSPDKAALAQAVAVYEKASERIWPGSRDQVLGFFDGFELLEPGLVPKHQWRSVTGEADADTPNIQWARWAIILSRGLFSLRSSHQLVRRP